MIRQDILISKLPWWHPDKDVSLTYDRSDCWYNVAGYCNAAVHDIKCLQIHNCSHFSLDGEHWVLAPAFERRIKL